jgi:hypothetical protein
MPPRKAVARPDRGVVTASGPQMVGEDTRAAQKIGVERRQHVVVAAGHLPPVNGCQVGVPQSIKRNGSRVGQAVVCTDLLKGRGVGSLSRQETVELPDKNELPVWVAR